MKKLKQLLLIVSISLCVFAQSPRDLLAQGTMHTLLTSGPDDRRINIVILAEAYTSEQEAKFIVDADSILSSLLSVSPWSEYKTYINGFALFVASSQSGADDPSASVLRNTYFNSTFDSYNTERLLTIPPNDRNPNYADGYGKVYSLLATYMPSFDLVLILVNDPQYGGSGGAFAISSVNTLATQIVIHELGHSFAKLGDEYSNSYPGYPDVEEPNTTRVTVRELIKWNSWISSSVPIPTPATTPYGASVGLFEGAHYHVSDWYRPFLDCEMRSLGKAFCPVCSQAHVLANYTLLSPIDSVFPPSAAVTIDLRQSITLRVVPKKPTFHSLLIRWYDDGRPLTITTPSATFAAGSLADGVNTITCVVTDTTSLVRVDPLGQLRDSAMWTVTVEASCVCMCHGDPYCDGTVSNILDIVRLVDIAHRGEPALATGDCSHVDADLDCSGTVNVIDVIHAVNVAFRGADPAAGYCNPCQ